MEISRLDGNAGLVDEADLALLEENWLKDNSLTQTVDRARLNAVRRPESGRIAILPDSVPGSGRNQCNEGSGR